MNPNQYPTLEAMPAFEGLVIDADGTTTLQPSQLQAVETVLAREAAQQETINGLQAQLDEANAQLQNREQRIRELEASLTAAQQRLENPDPQNPEVHENPEAAGSVESAEDWDEALAICNKFLGK
jgi:chromosome segregation ATPase